MQKIDIIQEGTENGDGMVMLYRTRKGTDIFCLGVPTTYSSDGNGSPGPTWCYLIAGDELTLIDTGQWGHDQELQSLIKKTGHDISDIDNLVVTHAHEDHDGSMPEVIQASGARLWAHYAYDAMISYHEGIDGGADHPEFPGSCRCCPLPADFHIRCFGYHKKRSCLKTDRPVRDNYYSLDRDLYFILTPGHTPDSMCAVFQNEVLFSGDTLLASITPHPSLMLEYRVNKQILPEGYGSPKNVYGLMAYLDSLDRLRKQCEEIDLLLPGHKLFEKGAINYLRPEERAEEIIGFHRERCDNILRIIGDKVLSPEDISRELFEARLRRGFGKLMAQREVMSHLELMAVCGDTDWVEADKFTSRATGSDNYRDYFSQYIRY